MTTAGEVVDLARARYGRVGVAELAQVYAALSHAEPHPVRSLVVASAPVAGSPCGMLLADAIRKVGPAPADLLCINIYDPCCGVGVVSHHERAHHQLYAGSACAMLVTAFADERGHVADSLWQDLVRACVETHKAYGRSPPSRRSPTASTSWPATSATCNTCAGPRSSPASSTIR